MKLVSCPKCDGVKRFVEFGTGKHFCEECDAELDQSPQAASEAVSAEFAGYAKHPSVEVLSGEIEKIKQAVHDGVYGTRSLIGDSVLLMEHHVNELKKDGS